MAEITERETIDQLYAWQKEGALCRDTPGKSNPYPANTIAYFEHMSGWLTRDLQLCLARANPAYRWGQIQSGTITVAGIRGGYGFEPGSPFVEAPTLK